MRISGGVAAPLGPLIVQKKSTERGGAKMASGKVGVFLITFLDIWVPASYWCFKTSPQVKSKRIS